MRLWFEIYFNSANWHTKLCFVWSRLTDCGKRYLLVCLFFMLPAVCRLEKYVSLSVHHSQSSTQVSLHCLAAIHTRYPHHSILVTQPTLANFHPTLIYNETLHAFPICAALSPLSSLFVRRISVDALPQHALKRGLDIISPDIGLWRRFFISLLGWEHLGFDISEVDSLES